MSISQKLFEFYDLDKKKTLHVQTTIVSPNVYQTLIPSLSYVVTAVRYEGRPDSAEIIKLALPTTSGDQQRSQPCEQGQGCSTPTL